MGYPSLNNTPQEIIDTVAVQINAQVIAKKQTVHFVGHSLGGLMIRAFLDSNKLDNLGRVVLIGTPNQGTPIVDKFRDSWWMKLFGPMPRALGTDESSFPNSIGDPYYPVGIIAGVSNAIYNEKIIPGEDDGVVPLESTKLDGMTDMIIIEGGHSMMRYNRDVAKQTIEFLKKGSFSKD